MPGRFDHFDEEVKEAFRVLDSRNWTPTEIAIYEKIELDRQDRINELARAKEIGAEEALREIVKKLAEHGVSHDIIQKATGLSTEEISELLN